MAAYFDYRFRIILIGDHAAGKSSLVESYVTGNFKEPTIPTIGADFFTTLVDLDRGPCVKLEIWDTAGQEKFRAITQSYYRGSVGIVLVYDICKRGTYENLWKWVMEARAYTDVNEPVFVLVGCKSDLAEEDGRREVTEEEAMTLGQQYGMYICETSAKSGVNVSAPFIRLAQDILNRVEAGEYNIKGDWTGVQAGSTTISPPETVIERFLEEPKSKSKCCSYF